MFDVGISLRGQHELVRISPRLGFNHVRSEPCVYRIEPLQLSRNLHEYVRRLMLFENVSTPHVGSLGSDRLYRRYRIRSRLLVAE